MTVLKLNIVVTIDRYVLAGLTFRQTAKPDCLQGPCSCFLSA